MSLSTSKRQWLWIERFPVTILLGTQYTVMVMLPALVKDTEPQGTIVAICVVATLAALYIELLAAPLRPTGRQYRPVSERGAQVVLAVGLFANVGSALGGQGTYAAQLGQQEVSPLVGLLTPFTSWALIGLALYLWRYREGQVTRRRVLVVAGATCLVIGLVGLQRAILGQAAALIVTVFVLAILARLVRMRVLVATLLLIPVFWPPIYEFRDDTRRSVSGTATIVSGDNPAERLQLDEQMSIIRILGQEPGHLNPPTMGTVLRTGLIPGFLDHDRPPMDTGSRISVALGGAETNSRSATMLGNAYIFGGMALVAAISAALAVAIGIALRERQSPWALAVVGLVYYYGISFNATYPNMVASILQGLTSMLLAYLVTRMIASRRAVARSEPVVHDPRRDRTCAKS